MEWLSEKQQDFFAFSDAKVNIAEGAVRSGKTHVCLHRFVDHSVNAPPGDMMILGKTGDTIERNVVRPLIELFPWVKHVRGKHVKIGDRFVYLVGANDEQAESKVRGSTLVGGYINEVTLAPETVFNQLIARCSLPGAKIFGDTNPDSPFHWLRKNQILNPNHTPDTFMHMSFVLDDNETLEERYKEDLKILYSASPLWYQRMILGKWVAAEGAIYSMFNPELYPHGHIVEFLPRTYDKIICGVDYGTASVTTFVLLGRNNGVWYLFREYYHDARTTMVQKTNSQFAEDFEKFVDGEGYRFDKVGPVHPETIEIDASATGLKKELHNLGFVQVRSADNDVVEGIRNVQDAFATEDLRFAKWCENSAEEHSGYVWDEDKQKEEGLDVPVKKNDHTCDAVRYALKRHYWRRDVGPVDKAVGS
jgi:PBSX family phage terminase large subunit